MVSIEAISPALAVLGWLTYYQPRHASTLLVFLIPTYLLRTEFAGIPTNVFELSVALVFIICAAQASIRRYWVRHIVTLPKWVGVATASFFFSAAVGVFVSAEREVSLGILKGWFVVPLLFGWLIYTHRKPRDVIRALLASGVVVSLIAILSTPFGDRARGIYDVPNSLALFLAPLAAMSIWYAFHERRWHDWLTSVVLVVGLLSTQSLAALVALLAVLVLVAIRANNNNKRHMIVVVFVLAIIGFLTMSTSGRFTYFAGPFLGTGVHTSASVRLQLWSVAAELIGQRPLLGVGLGQFEPWYQATLHTRSVAGVTIIPEFVFRDPHNWILSMWVNLGLVGLVAFVVLNAVAVLKPARGRSQQVAKLALITLLVYGLVDTIYWKNDLSALHWLLLGILFSSPVVVPEYFQQIED